MLTSIYNYIFIIKEYMIDLMKYITYISWSYPIILILVTFIIIYVLLVIIKFIKKIF